jgi:hypothetical protein
MTMAIQFVAALACLGVSVAFLRVALMVLQTPRSELERMEREHKRRNAIARALGDRP